MNKSGAVRAFHFQSHHPIGDSLSPVYPVFLGFLEIKGSSVVRGDLIKIKSGTKKKEFLWP